MSDFNENNVIFLPQTVDAFDTLISQLVEHYQLPNPEHAAAVVANRIQHLPPDQATVTLKYLGHCIMKNIAYQVAKGKSEILSHRAQVDDIVAHIKTNPNDQQARDALYKAVTEGSEYAKDALEKIDPMDNVTQLMSPQSVPPGSV